MAAVIRIKRRLDENPLETLVLNCKRRKVDGTALDKPEELSTVLKLAGTVQEEGNIDVLLKKHNVGSIPELKEQFKKHTVNVSDKVRSEIKKTSKDSRYRVVNCFRKTLSSEDGSEEAGKSTASEVTVLDIETDCNKNDSATQNKNKLAIEVDKPKYVYDFYYTSSDDFGEADIQDYVNVYPLCDPLVFGSIRDNGLDELDSENDSEDSNAECNWRNDYPDEDDLESVNEDDMVAAVKNMNIDEDLLSSDSGEENLVYSREEEDFQDVDDEDEMRYGTMYAKFKAKHKNVESTVLSNDLYYGDIDEEEYYY